MNNKTIKTVWEMATYDVWGNKQDGFEVNDVYRHGEIELTLKVTHNNVGTPQAFDSAYPSDYQLKKVFGVGCAIDTDGDDLTVYVNRASDGYQIGELHCISHESLSPIREAKPVSPSGDYVPESAESST